MDNGEAVQDIGSDALRRARQAVHPRRGRQFAGEPEVGQSTSGRFPEAGRTTGAPDPSVGASVDPLIASGRRRRKRRPSRASQGGWSGSGPHPRDPQAIGSVASRLFAERGWDRTLAESRVVGDWASLVGADIAAQSEPVALREGELRISASSTAWATQLRLLAPALLARIADQVGAGVVTKLSISGPTAPSWKHGPRVFRGRGPRDTYG